MLVDHSSALLRGHLLAGRPARLALAKAWRSWSTKRECSSDGSQRLVNQQEMPAAGSSRWSTSSGRPPEGESGWSTSTGCPWDGRRGGRRGRGMKSGTSTASQPRAQPDERPSSILAAAAQWIRARDEQWIVERRPRHATRHSSSRKGDLLTDVSLWRLGASWLHIVSSSWLLLSLCGSARAQAMISWLGRPVPGLLVRRLRAQKGRVSVGRQERPVRGARRSLSAARMTFSTSATPPHLC